MIGRLHQHTTWQTTNVAESIFQQQHRPIVLQSTRCTGVKIKNEVMESGVKEKGPQEPLQPPNAQAQDETDKEKQAREAREALKREWQDAVRKTRPKDAAGECCDQP